MAELRVALVLATSTGGVGRHVAAVAHGLSARQLPVAVLGPRATNERFQFGAPFRAVEIGAALRPLELVKTLGALLRLRRLTRRADVVHAHGFRAALVTALALGRLRERRGRRPVFVVTFHNAMSGGEFRRELLSTVMRRLARVADAAFVVSPDLDAVIENSSRALIAAPISTPSAFVDDLRSALAIPDGASVVLAIGRLHPQKGFDLLVRAASTWETRARPIVVLIAGDGPQRATLTALIDDLRVDVRLLGDREDIADLLQIADVVAMPSRWEGWPLTAGEVLTAGRPLVAAAVGGLPELVGDAAVLVPPDDVTALAAAISSLLDDVDAINDHRLRATKRASELPTEDDVIAQLISRYADLVGES